VGIQASLVRRRMRAVFGAVGQRIRAIGATDVATDHVDPL
jgi:hypothetical protein